MQTAFKGCKLVKWIQHEIFQSVRLYKMVTYVELSGKLTCRSTVTLNSSISTSKFHLSTSVLALYQYL